MTKNIDIFRKYTCSKLSYFTNNGLTIKAWYTLSGYHGYVDTTCVNITHYVFM